MHDFDVIAVNLAWKNQVAFHDSSLHVSIPNFPPNKHKLLVAYIFTFIYIQFPILEKQSFFFASFYAYIPILLQAKIQEKEKYKRVIFLFL